ncbi:glycosyltransferase family 2 protein [Gonapodya prolifera JEL478]|uniref:Glycosyltransferase family 2 protein n=1 Tax=Gonapodya prolifera (strain JEL478) TaxID=1344416 RepID=A0A139B145_GONPJ|nr:glycosyltransferase family 2 protein [Gonapodya prolifera JEL478]|eukprot:KXS22435.1 glycosyltransferase family 2 protein [Gonapodya prolifera JEL478]
MILGKEETTTFKRLLKFTTVMSFGLLMLVVGAGYLFWRVLNIIALKPSNPVPYIFFALEAILYTSAIVWLIDLLWSEPPDRSQPPPPKRWPTVDILVPCCTEPTELIKDTVKAALGQDYPRECFMVHICDDGGDDVLKDWIQNELQKERNLNVNYIRRVKIKGVPHHYKAGNMNHALGITHGEYVGVLDSDMITAPDFLATLVPYLYERTDVAFVQSPQAYYNIPAGDPLAHYTTMFYDIIMPWRDGRDSAPCVGTGMIFRRKALEDIGGFSIGTITEDFDTAMACQNRGWKTIYVNKKMQFGLVPDTLDATLKQRERWGVGTLQIFFKRNPLLMKGQLKFHQRVMYFSAGMSYLLPVAILAFTLLPFLTIVFDWPVVPVRAGETKILMMFLGPWLLMNRVLFYSLYWGLPGGFQARNRDPQLFIWMSPYLFVALLKYMFPFLETTFKVTNTAKNMEQTNALFTLKGLRTVWFHLLYVLGSIGIFVWRVYVTNFSKCEDTFKLVMQAIFLAYNVQNMIPPVLFLVNPISVDPDLVRTYDEYGIPHVPLSATVPPTGKFIFILEIIPAALILVCMMVLVAEAAGVTDKLIGSSCAAAL